MIVAAMLSLIGLACVFAAWHAVNEWKRRRQRQYRERIWRELRAAMDHELHVVVDDICNQLGSKL